jgi:PAS domain S-box-containing protein
MTLTTRLAIAMIALVAIAVSAVGWLSYRNLEQALLPRVLDRIETHSRFIAAELDSHVRSGPGDITTFQGLAAVAGLMRARLNGGIDPVDLTTEAVWRERLAGRLAAQMALKPAYSLRFIGVADGHREIVRVDRSGPNGAVRIVPEAELKRVGDAPYFRDTIKLAADQIYVSPVSLSEENGVIETPHAAILQIAKPVLATDGKPFGIVIVNVDMRPALDRVRSSVRPGEKVYVVDGRGDYLVHPDRSREFGSQLGAPTDWRRDMPYLAASLGAAQGFARIIPDQAAPPSAVAFAPAMLSGSEWVAVIEAVPNAAFMAPAAAIRNSSILVGLIAVLCAAALALLIARSLTRPIVELTRAVEAAPRDGMAAIPVAAGGETGVLARAFAHVMDEANAKTVALEREVEEHRRTIAARDHHAERERLFSAAVESSNDAIITMSLDGTITGWNSAAERLFGYTAAEAAGKNISLIIPADRLSEVQDTVRRIGWGESIEHNETVRLRKDGSLVEVSLSISPIKAPSGATIGISKVARDITDSNKTRLALRQQAEERRRIFETSQDLILVMDASGILVQVSPSSQSILGYLPQEMVGRNALEFTYVEDIARSNEEVRAERRGQRTRNFSSRCVHKDGRAVTLSWMGVWSEPVKRFFYIGRDMTESQQAQETLRESEQLARGIINSAIDAFVQVDQRGIIRDWNPQAEIMLGWPREDVLGKNVFELMGRQDGPGPVRTALERFLLSGREQVQQPRREVQIKRRDGTVFTAELSITALRTRDGFVFNGFIRDITERNRIQQTLKQQAEELRNIFETSQDLIMVMDSRGSLVQISPSCEAILGYPPAEMIGRTGIDFIHPDHLENSREEMRALRRGERPKIADTQCVHKDGRKVWLSWLGVWSEPVERFFFVGRDMTESRLAQETLRESERLARGIIDTALDAFVQLDEQGAILDWNSQAERIFGWSRSEAVGAKLGELIIPEINRDAHKSGMERFLHTGEGPILGRRFEVEALRRDGKEIKVELSVTELRRRDGFVFNGFIRDLTDKIAAEDRIRQSEKMEAVGQLTGGIAHDFNNILTVITGTIEILADAVKGEPQLAAITRMIDEAATRGADLTRHLLAFARKQPLEPKETDVNTLIIETARLLQRTLGEQVEIESVFEDDACVAIVDPNQLATAILNLALNARDAMPGGGKLIIETGTVVLDENYTRTHGDVRPGPYAMIAVSDTGSGIPAAMLDKVFNPFFTSKGPGKGTGLGLSMVYGFIKQSAGHIKIYSEEGHGTTVKMYLPPAAGESVPVTTAPAPTVVGGHETILVVEDDKLVRDYVLTQLHSLGYVTLDAANAAEAMAIVNAGHEFDLLFTDVIMPGLNGRQLADEMLKARPALKVLFTSGYTENAIIHHGRLDEGVLLLAKPYRKSDMAIMIRKALAD